MKQNAKKCAICETKCYEILSLYLRKTEKRKKDGGEGEERGLRKEQREIERKETKLKRRIRNTLASGYCSNFEVLAC